jgi:hypothetical protein
MSFLKSFLTAAAVVFALPAYAQTITISDAYARVATPTSPSGAAFLIIENKGAEADHLVGVASEIAEMTQMHTHIADAAGVMQMVEVPGGWDIPAGGTHTLQRGADHIMFMGLKQPLNDGDIVTVTLTFAKAGEVVVQIPVDLQRGAPAGAMGAMDHSAMMGGAAPMAGMDHGAMMGGAAPMAGMDHGAMMGGAAPMAGMDHGAMMGGMGMAAPAAAGNGLSAPVIMLTPFVRDNADALNLNEAQRADLKAWLEKPNARVVVENETIALRAELRAAIVMGAPKADRQALADKIGANEAKLVMARSDCTDHWREVLSPEQFTQLLMLAGVLK